MNQGRNERASLADGYLELSRLLAPPRAQPALRAA